VPSLPNIFWGVLALGGALSGYTYGLTSVNNSCKKAIRPAVFYLNMNPRDKYHNVNKQQTLCWLHQSGTRLVLAIDDQQQQQQTLWTYTTVVELNLSIFHHFNVRSPRSDPSQLLTYLLSDRRSDAIIIVTQKHHMYSSKSISRHGHRGHGPYLKLMLLWSIIYKYKYKWNSMYAYNFYDDELLQSQTAERINYRYCSW